MHFPVPAMGAAQELDAVCQAIDLPVTLRYAFRQKGKNAWAVQQAGLSSFLMLRERYTFSYTGKTGNGYGGTTYAYSNSLKIINENRHWFQVQSLVLSYSRALSPGLTVGVEPFVKIPLAGIGAGKVNLTRAGVPFSSSYTFQLKP